jgi:serine protease Do
MKKEGPWHLGLGPELLHDSILLHLVGLRRLPLQQHTALRCVAHLFQSILRISVAFLVASAPVAAQSAPDSESLRKLNSSIEALLRKVSPSVVQILVTGYGALEESDHGSTSVVIGRQRAIGSGFIIDPSGYIITNAHVVKGAHHVQVVLPSASEEDTPISTLSSQGNIVSASIVGTAPDVDLAVIKIDANNLPALPVARYLNLRQGEMVFAFGSPQGLRNSVTSGIISATARQLSTDSPLFYIQTDASINPGNSGGPLVNVNGEVVGVNTFILSESGGNEGLGFAISSSIINVSYRQIRKYGHVHRAEIGLGVQTITPSLATALNLQRTSGVMISDVLPGSAAEAAGLHIQDVLVSLDGKAVGSVPYFDFRLMTHDSGDKVHLEVLRGHDRLAFEVSATDPPHEIDQIAALTDPEKSLVRPLGILGLEIDHKIAGELPDLRDPYGILVVARSAESTVTVSLTAGDVIRTFNGEPMTTLDRLRNALQTVQSGTPIALQIQRNGHLLFLSFTLDPP